MPDDTVLNADLVAEMVFAYSRGYFPMADPDHHDETGWYNPPMRAVLPIAGLKVSRSLRRVVLKQSFDVRIDTDFERVIRTCAARRMERPETWINEDIIRRFMALHQAGLAHSVECWTPDGNFAGGLYGVALGGAFCGESMVSLRPEASKIALVHLCAVLQAGGFTLLDCQFINDHTARFGAVEIPQAEYLHRLAQALESKAIFDPARNNVTNLVNFLNKNLTFG